MQYNQATRNELLARLLSEIHIDDPSLSAQAGRARFLELRGEGVQIILSESEEISGRLPKYKLVSPEELQLTIYARNPSQ